jgi:hypothetical protein
MTPLSTNFPNDFYSDDLAKSFDFTGYFDNQKQRQAAFENQRINREMALESLFQSQQQFPLEQEQKRLNNQRISAELPGISANSDLLKIKAELAKGTQDAEYKSKLAGFAAKTSKAELEQEITQIQKIRLNPHISPQERAVLDFLYDQFGEIYKIQKTGEMRQSVEETKAASKPAPAGRATSAPRPPKDHVVAEAFWNWKAANTDDPEEKAYFTQHAASSAEANRRLLAEKAAAGLTGKPDIAGAAGLPVHPGLGGPANPATATRPTRQAESRQKPLYATNPQTKERIVSLDGGKTWSPAK